MKKVLFFLAHPAHYHLFKNIIQSLKEKKYSITTAIVTKDILEDLLKEEGLSYINLVPEGRRGKGAFNFLAITWGVLKTEWRLIKFLKKNPHDLLIGTEASLCHVGKLMNIPVSIVNEDDTKVLPQNKLFYPFATNIIMPRCCDEGMWGKKRIQYEGYHELAYLHPNHFTPDREVVKRLHPSDEPYFILRLAELSAHHDLGKTGITDEIALRLIKKLEQKGKVYITAERTLKPDFEPYRIKCSFNEMPHFLHFADLYIGDSQTMAAEAAVLGTPSIRYNDFVGKLSYLNELEDKYQLTQGIHTKHADELVAKVDEVLSTPNLKQVWLERKNRMLEEKVDVAKFLVNTVENSFGQIHAPAGAGCDLRVCRRCVMDTTVPWIQFDKQGVCNYCHIHDELEAAFPLNEETKDNFEKLVERIKRDSRKRPYDIVVGVSGGRDSTYALHICKKLGLRVLAVHFDNGWNSEIAVTNIKNATNKLGIDLHTFVIDWEEFKDLQLAFLKASVSDAEIPTDVAIHGLLHKIAVKEGIKYLIFAHSFRTEGIAPLTWTYYDGRYINSVYKRFGHAKLSNYPNMTLSNIFYYKMLKGIKAIPLLFYVDYNQEEVDRILKNELGWTYYGGHHHESYFTNFFQSYYLPKKFNIDKRKTEYSALIRSGQMNRQEALEEIRGTEYPYDENLVEYAVNKLGLSQGEFDDIMAAPNKSFHDYPTYYPFLKAMKFPINLACQFKLVPKHLYLKFFG